MDVWCSQYRCWRGGCRNGSHPPGPGSLRGPRPSKIDGAFLMRCVPCTARTFAWKPKDPQGHRAACETSSGGAGLLEAALAKRPFRQVADVVYLCFPCLADVACHRMLQEPT